MVVGDGLINYMIVEYRVNISSNRSAEDVDVDKDSC
jgi:hypothetical protein